MKISLNIITAILFIFSGFFKDMAQIQQDFYSNSFQWLEQQMT